MCFLASPTQQFEIVVVSEQKSNARISDWRLREIGLEFN